MKSLAMVVAAGLFSLTAGAQNTNTEKKHGTVVVNQSSEIDRIVNGNSGAPKEPQQTGTPQGPAEGTTGGERGHNAESTTNKTSTSRATNKTGKKKDEKEKEDKANVVKRGGKEYVHGKTTVYRICIYTGGNTRADKEKAQKMAQTCRSKFPKLNAYATFESPRWVTYAGLFKTREDAQRYATQIRKSKITYQTNIVSRTVNVK